jgi:hypothetical protein
MDADLAPDTSAFKYLINVASIIPIGLIETEWITLYKLARETGTTDLDLGPCSCQLLLRYSLPADITSSKPVIGGLQSMDKSRQLRYHQEGWMSIRQFRM